jgi:hypothetical protein
VNENARLRTQPGVFWVDHLPAGVSVEKRVIACAFAALFTEIGLINLIILVDHKAHDAGFPHSTGHASRAALTLAILNDAKTVAVIAFAGFGGAKRGP